VARMLHRGIQPPTWTVVLSPASPVRPAHLVLRPAHLYMNRAARTVTVINECVRKLRMPCTVDAMRYVGTAASYDIAASCTERRGLHCNGAQVLLGALKAALLHAEAVLDAAL